APFWRRIESGFIDKQFGAGGLDWPGRECFWQLVNPVRGNTGRDDDCLFNGDYQQYRGYGGLPAHHGFCGHWAGGKPADLSRTSCSVGQLCLYDACGYASECYYLWKREAADSPNVESRTVAEYRLYFPADGRNICPL